MSETKQVNGVIESISFGEVKEGQYGRSAMCWVKVNGDSYSCFAKEHNGVCNIQNKVGDVYTNLQQGMQVIFNAIKNGDYWNFKPSTAIILASGAQATPAPAQQQQVSPPVQQPTPQATAAPTASDALTADDLKDMVADGQAACNALVKGKTPNMDMLKRMSGYYRKVL